MPKKRYHNLLCLFSALSLASSVFAGSKMLNIDSEQEILLSPKCFLDGNGFEYQELAFNKSKDFVLFSVNREYWWQQLSKVKHTKECGKFLSVDHNWNLYLATQKFNAERVSNLDYEYFLNDFLLASNKKQPTVFNRQDISDEPNKPELLESLYANLDQDRIWSSLDELTSFYNRAAYTDYGYKAAAHIKAGMELLAINSNKSTEDFSVDYVHTTRYYKQPSVVAVLGKDLPGKAIVVSAHMDTSGGGRRPGADDDGSGSMVVLETARLVLESGYQFNRPIYFVWYAAEEMGLVGSSKVVQYALDKNLEIDSVLHFDTVGRRAKADDPTLFLLRDNVDQGFTDYVSDLIKEHVKVPVDYTTCGYACSDHASWNSKGFSATAAFESKFDDMNPYLHTSSDTKNEVSLENLVNYTKLALAYVVDKAA